MGRGRWKLVFMPGLTTEGLGTEVLGESGGEGEFGSLKMRPNDVGEEEDALGLVVEPGLGDLLGGAGRFGLMDGEEIGPSGWAAG